MNSDLLGVGPAVAGGFLARLNDDPHLVTMTEKGEAYLDLLMRCE